MKKIYFLFLALCCFNALNAQVVSIPDVAFKKFLLETSPIGINSENAKDLNGNPIKIDSNNDGRIQISEARKVGTLNIMYYINIQSLKGIKSFSNLKELTFSNFVLTSLDLAGLNKIVKLNIPNNKLAVLNITGLTNLEYLDCSSNLLKSLDVVKFKKLKYLSCNYNLLESINIKGLSNLEFLDVQSNKNLKELDVSSLINLKELGCTVCNLTSLNVKGAIMLERLYCANNSLTSLDVSGLSKLKELRCEYNKLIDLNLNNTKILYDLQCYNNELTSLDIDNLNELYFLNCCNNMITSLNLTKTANIGMVYCGLNMITSLNAHSLKKLGYLDCAGNSLTSLDLYDLPNLYALTCNNNQLTEINLKKTDNLITFHCSYNQISTLNVNDLIELLEFSCEYNNLSSLYMKNGNNQLLKYNTATNYFEIEETNFIINFRGNPNLKYICTDESKINSLSKYFTDQKLNCEINSYCSFKPGGISYEIKGTTKLDANLSGCDALDNVYPNLKLNITDGKNIGSFISNASGNYTIPVIEGTHSFTPVLENPDYFSISPATASVDFSVQNSPFIQDFCVTPNGTNPDLEVLLLPIDRARPGFDASYKLVYKNKGNITKSGTVNLTFDDSILDLVSSNTAISNQTVNKLSWDFSNLKPFESKEIVFTLNVNSPMEIPAVNNNDTLKFITTITSQGTDETPNDNTFTLNQTVVGSFDPNDKTCLEGSVITSNLIGEYVHYMIRFENTGTYRAQNIVVKDMIDLSKFDISTLIPTNSSHSFVTKISESNKVEFIFENINLPFDDANNDGYVAFKIKTKPTLKVGDSFTNEANIYFDYNFPILTNKATSKFQNTLANPDFEFSNYFTLYPNPTNNVLNINAKQTIEIESLAVYDILGQLVIAVPNAKSVFTIDVSQLRTGNYFLKVKSDKGSSGMKFIKN